MSEERLNRAVAGVLAAGMAAALACMAVGALLGALGPAAVSGPAPPAGALPAALAAGSPGAWLSLGVVILLATPAARVAVLAWGLARRGEWALAAVAAAVLGVLAFSLRLG